MPNHLTIKKGDYDAIHGMLPELENRFVALASLMEDSLTLDF